jgi:hypothetical protein
MITAEEFLNPDWKDGDQFDREEVCKYIIKFEKLHVKAALKAASEKAKIRNIPGVGEMTEISKMSILNSYPESNII